MRYGTKNLAYTRNRWVVSLVCNAESKRKLIGKAKEVISTKMHEKRLSNLHWQPGYQSCCQEIILIVRSGYELFWRDMIS